MKNILIIIFTLITTISYAQFNTGVGCYTYKYVETKADTTTEIIPAVIQVIPAIYKDTVLTKIVSPEYTEQYIDCSNNRIKICNRIIPAIKQCYKSSYMIKPEQVIVINAAYAVKTISNVRPGHVIQVPCEQ